MKQQIYNTFIGLAALTIFVVLLALLTGIYQYLQTNYVFNFLYLCYILAVIMGLVSANLLGRTINSGFKK